MDAERRRAAWKSLNFWAGHNGHFAFAGVMGYGLGMLVAPDQLPSWLGGVLLILAGGYGLFVILHTRRIVPMSAFDEWHARGVIRQMEGAYQAFEQGDMTGDRFPPPPK